MRYLILAIIVTAWLYCFLMLYRNGWVHKTICGWLDQISKMPSAEGLKILRGFNVDSTYRRMLLRWWSWDTRMEAWKK